MLSNVSTIQGQITTLESDVSGKQNTIGELNKVLSSNIDYSSSPLRFIDISSNLQSQLTGLTNSLNALISEDTSQNTLNTQYTSDINSLYSNKQNTITDLNKVSSLYTSYNATTVKAELDTVNTTLSNKLNTSSFTKTGLSIQNVDNTSDVSKPVSTAQQTALDLKLNSSVVKRISS